MFLQLRALCPHRLPTYSPAHCPLSLGGEKAAGVENGTLARASGPTQGLGLGWVVWRQRGLGLHCGWAGTRPHLCHLGATPLASDNAPPVGSLLGNTRPALCLPVPCCVPRPAAVPGGHPVRICCLRGTTHQQLPVCGSVSPLTSPSSGVQGVSTDIWSLHLLYQHVLYFKFVEKAAL